MYLLAYFKNLRRFLITKFHGYAHYHTGVPAYKPQLWKIVRLMTLILLIGALHVSAKGTAQDISLDLKDQPVKAAFSRIEQQTGYLFLYDPAVIEGVQKINVRISNRPLTEALDLCLHGTGLAYTIVKKNIIISRPAAPPGAPADFFRMPPALHDIRVHITDSTGAPLQGASVVVKGTKQGGQTDAEGNITLTGVTGDETLVVSFVGYETKEVSVGDETALAIVLKQQINELEGMNVLVSTGYQYLPMERSTGSFAVVNNKLFNRSVSTDVLSRLNGVTSGLIFNKVANHTGPLSSNGGDPGISIRGRSTLFANTEPLIVLDNFPYDGDLDNINPNDVESVTILKDAAAASIWGVRAANGVIVITTKKGRLNQPPKISFNTNITVAGKPDVYSVPQMTSAAYIGLEKYWFDNGKYNLYLNFLPYSVQSPVVDILDKEKKGSLTVEAAQAQIDALSKIDVRDDYSKYFLRKAVNQQYALNISGGSATSQYYVSGSFDRDLLSDVAGSYSRINITAGNTYHFFKDRLTLNTNILFTKSKTRSNYNTYSPQYPYEQLVGADGKALPVVRDYRQASKDALSNAGLLDWNYYPYNERLNDNNVTDLTDYRIGARLDYKIISKVLDIELNYQYQQGNTSQTITNDQSTYNTRLLINQYAQIDPSGNISYPVPLGAIVYFADTRYQSNSGRLQLNYNKQLGTKHAVTAIAGTEVRDYNAFQKSSQVYGYNASTATDIPVDIFTYYNYSISPSSGQIPVFYRGQSGSTDRFFSYYANAGYTYLDRYTFSASARRDESNLFGVAANQKGVPLYSLGLGWVISKEAFYKFSALPFLKLRLTDGYNGNLSKNLSAYTTARTDGNNSQYNAPQQIIINPPNPSLIWERVQVLNAGLDFGFRNNVASGSIDLYSKKGMDLIGNSPVAPQAGVIQFTGNTADLLTKGIDLVLNSNNINGAFSWTTNFLFNYVKDKVTTYKMQTGVISNYVNSNYANPLVGKPYASIFAYPWAGLDDAGNPQGYMDGQVSEDYGGILSSTDLADLKYVGTATPTIFGSLRNNFAYKNIELSFNVTYKMGYYFRRGSFTSSSGSYQQGDYSLRWQQPGDENTTSVPGLTYPVNSQRDMFYNGSEVLVIKGDHIRLQDIQLSYTITDNKHKLPFAQLKIYAYTTNLGILWRANKLGLDPDYVGHGHYTVPNPRTLSFGVQVIF